ncbi:unnamed protein product, partial [Polarella glacialis]
MPTARERGRHKDSAVKRGSKASQMWRTGMQGEGEEADFKDFVPLGPATKSERKAMHRALKRYQAEKDAARAAIEARLAAAADVAFLSGVADAASPNFNLLVKLQMDFIALQGLRAGPVEQRVPKVISELAASLYEALGSLVVEHLIVAETTRTLVNDYRTWDSQLQGLQMQLRAAAVEFSEGVKSSPSNFAGSSQSEIACLAQRRDEARRGATKRLQEMQEPASALQGLVDISLSWEQHINSLLPSVTQYLNPQGITTSQNPTSKSMHGCDSSTDEMPVAIFKMHFYEEWMQSWDPKPQMAATDLAVSELMK